MSSVPAWQTWMDALTCERFKYHGGVACLKDFEQSFDENVNVLQYALENADEEDSQGRCAYYLVRDRFGESVFFFSLKTGALFNTTLADTNPLRNAKRLMKFSKSVQQLLDTSVDPNELKDEIQALLERQGVTYKDLLTELFKKHKAKTDYFHASEDGLDQKSHSFRVLDTIPSIELVHFCKNSRYEDKFRALGAPRSVGEIVFWRFVADRILSVAELMGCEYLYLFAADKTGDANLRNYYEASLKFKEDAEHGVGMPIYDWTCFLMSQPIANIKVLQDSFFSMIEESRDDWFAFDLT